MPKSKPLLVLVDASSFIFRAFYAIRQLNTKSGIPTNATFGFANMILKVLEDLHPSHIAVVYDTKHPSFRKERYAEYKANRSAMPDELVPQIPYIKKFVETMGLPRFEKPGLEADDIIAALAHFAREREEEVCIVSSDKDLMQLVNHHTWLFDTMKNQKIGANEVKEKMGVGPELITDYLGIVGDSSDNIPGVKGIGPKGAVALLEEYGSVEGIYKNLDKMKAGKQRENLEASKENAFLSKELATVRTEVEIDFAWPDLECHPVYNQEMVSLLSELEFHKMGERIARLTAGSAANIAGAEPVTAASKTALGAPVIEESPAIAGDDEVKACGAKYLCITSNKELDEVFSRLKKHTEISIDTETTGLSHTAKIVGFSFCAEDENSYYVPLRHEAEGGQCDLHRAIQSLRGFLQGKKLIGQNIKYDINIFRREGLDIDPEQVYFDTMLASYVIEPGNRHGMDELSRKHLGHETIKYSDVCGTGKNEISFAAVPLDKATEYAAEDAHVTWLLYKKLQPMLEAEAGIKRVYNQIEVPLISVLADMEWIGVEVDKKHLAKLSTEFATDMERFVKEAYELAGGEFNLASPKQLQEILFEKLKLPTFKKTKTGFSTDVEVLTKLAVMHELPAVILSYRELAKLKSTYVDVLPDLANGDDRVHTSYQQTVAATGRLSSSDPNLQNIPIRTEQGKKIRAAFRAKKSCVLLGADYSQIELRILAHMCGDEQLRQAFRDGLDIHSLTAAKVFHVNAIEVTPDLRRKAKAINFGLLYGKTAFSLAEELAITRAEASRIIEDYFEQYPTVKKFLEGLAESAREKGYAETLYGRRRRIEGINDRNKMIKNMAERMAVNTPIQGTAADLMKVAMNRLHQKLRASDLKARMILQVHDELVLEVPESEIREVIPMVRSCMEGAGSAENFPKIDVPLTVEIGTGANWLTIN